MANATIDHIVSIIVFLGALLLFISLFNQTIQTATVYQNHKAVASKCSDTIDNVLLSPGVPTDWSQTNTLPTSFGLQDPEFTQYTLSPFALMRLFSASGTPVYYSKTGMTYSNITLGFGESLLVPESQAINYSTALKLLGLNGSYGFRLTLEPTVKVEISEQQRSPLRLAISVLGSGFPLSNSQVSYCFIAVEGCIQGYPAYTASYGTLTTDGAGYAYASFQDFNADEDSYMFIAYAHLNGLVGMGYRSHVVYDQNYVIPLVSDFQTGEVILAHSWDVHGGSDPAEIAYNATFVLLAEDFTLREMPLDNATGRIVGRLNYCQESQFAYATLAINTHNPGILIVTYSNSAVENGVIVMPWGISALGFPVEFGGDPSAQEWVATDIRVVRVGGLTYQAKLSMWSEKGISVMG
jgi:hypothetical protein